MKTLLAAVLAVTLLAGPVFAQTTDPLPAPPPEPPTFKAMPYGWEKAKASMGCAGSGIEHAFRGDFSQWVLPNFIGGTHMRAGQYIEPTVDQNGNGRCEVRGG